MSAVNDFLENIDEQDLRAGFDDIEALTADCRFRDCEHEHEPGCAVVAATEAGMLDPARLRSFIKLRAELRHHAARHGGADHERRRSERGLSRRIKQAKRLKRR